MLFIICSEWKSATTVCFIICKFDLRISWNNIVSVYFCAVTAIKTPTLFWMNPYSLWRYVGVLAKIDFVSVKISFHMNLAEIRSHKFYYK